MDIRPTRDGLKTSQTKKSSKNKQLDDTKPLSSKTPLKKVKGTQTADDTTSQPDKKLQERESKKKENKQKPTKLKTNEKLEQHSLYKELKQACGESCLKEALKENNTLKVKLKKGTPLSSEEESILKESTYSKVNSQFIEQARKDYNQVIENPFSSEVFTIADLLFTRPDLGDEYATTRPVPYLEEKLRSGPLDATTKSEVQESLALLKAMHEAGASTMNLLEHSKVMLGDILHLENKDDTLGIFKKIINRGEQTPNADDLKNKIHDLKNKEHPNTIDSIKDLHDIAQELIDSPNIKTTDKEDLQKISNVLEYRLTQAIKQDIRNKLKKHLASAQGKGNSTQVTIGLSVGGGIEGATVKATLSGSWKIFGSDDTKIRVTESISLSIGAKGGINILELKGVGSLSKGKTEVFTNIDHFLDHYEDSLIIAPLSKNIKGFKLRKESLKSEKLKDEIDNTRAQLVNNLKLKGIIHLGDNIRPLEDKKAPPVIVDSKSGAIGANTSGGYKALNTQTDFEVSIQASKTSTTFKKATPLLSFLNTNPEYLDKEINTRLRPLQLAQQTSSDKEYLLTNEFQKRLESTKTDKELETIIDDCANALDDLHTEFLVYQKTVQQFEGNGTNSTKRQAELCKMDLEIAKNECTGRGEFLRCTILAHSKIKQNLQAVLSKTSISDEKKLLISKKIQLAEESYSFPEFKLTKTHNKELQGQSQFKGGSTQITVSGTLYGQSISVSYQNIHGHLNPDNEGKYLNISIPYEALALRTDGKSAGIQSSLKGINRAMGANENLDFDQDSLDAAMTMPLPEGLSTSMKLVGTISFMKNEANGKYYPLYTRLQSTLQVGGAGDISTGTGAVLGGTLELQVDRSFDEKVHAYSCAYIATKYDGWKAGHGEKGENPKWDKFKQKHKNAFHDVFKNCANPKSPISIDVNRIFSDEIGDSNHPLKAKLAASTQAYKDNPSKENFDKAMTDFTEMLDLREQAVFGKRNKELKMKKGN